MKRKTAIASIIASCLSVVMSVGLIAGSIVSEKTFVKVDASVIERDVTSSFKAIYEALGGDSVADNSGQIVMPSSDYNADLYYGENIETEYSYSFHKGGHTCYVRNYNKQNAHYYLTLARADSGKVDTTASYVSLTQKSGSLFKIKTITITTRDSNHPVLEASSTWTGAAENVVGMSWSSNTGTYTFADGADNVIIGSNITTNNVVSLETITVTLSSFTDVYILTFDSQGGSYVPAQYLDSAKVTQEPAEPTKATVGDTSYKFLGWYDDPDAGNKFVFGSTIAADTTLYAHWEEAVAQKYTVTFNTNGGSSISPVEVLEGMKVERPANPTKVHEKSYKYTYEFVNWYTEPELVNIYDFDTLVESDLTLYAKYTMGYQPVPEGVFAYDIAGGATNKDDSWNASYAGNYTYIVLDSYETFDQSRSLPQLSVNVEHTEATGNSGGINYQSPYRNNPCIRNAKVTISLVDTSKVITYARIQMENYGSTATHEIYLYANNNEVSSDSEPTIPGSADKTTRLLQASFQDTDLVKSINFSFKNYAFAKVRYVWLGLADDPSDSAALAYATAFNNANVCGTSDEDGLNESKWTAQAEAFDLLDPDVQEYLATYEGDNAEILECLERYDRVVYLHGASYDFMDRITLAGISVKQPSNNTMFGSQANAATTTTVIIILVVASVSLISLSCLLVFRKKKH